MQPGFLLPHLLINDENVKISTYYSLHCRSTAPAARNGLGRGYGFGGNDRLASHLGVIDPHLLPIGYCGKEKLVYDVSWSGGIKIGELHMEVNALPESKEGYEIRAIGHNQKRSAEPIYPIEDLHVTRVRGPNRLPYYYEVWQKEGFKYRAHRVIEYDQEKGYIRYMKNEKLEGEYHIAGETNNEFSSFFNSRLMTFDIGDNL